MLPQHFNTITLGMSLKADGQMSVHSPEAQTNRERYFTSVGIDPSSSANVRLAHGHNVKVLTAADRGIEQHDCDGLVTRDRDVCLTITVSDCLPLFFYDETAGIIGLAHAGWRGVVGNIASNMVQTMIACGSIAEDIRVFIGPHIKPCHFEIKDDILPNFLPYPDAIIHRDGKIFIDLAAIVTQQLNDALRQETHAMCLYNGNITTHPDCTFCSTEYFSYRRGDKPSQVAWIVRR